MTQMETICTRIKSIRRSLSFPGTLYFDGVEPQRRKRGRRSFGTCGKHVAPSPRVQKTIREDSNRRDVIVRIQLVSAFVASLLSLSAAAQIGAEIYEAACAACHGSDGRGLDRSALAFPTPMPDFTDCDFASREPDADWFAVAHRGGPARGFDRMMPAFGEALTEEEIQASLDNIRTMCRDARWPRGELNMPRALFTEKAYPEDEAVITTTVVTEGRNA